nr:unnamed protein product [Callosobruchus analis]
MLQKIHQTRRH